MHGGTGAAGAGKTCRPIIDFPIWFFVGYRDADIVLPVQELAQLNRVVRVVDETEPDYPFDQLKQRYDGTLLAQYIETLEAYPDAASGRKALYYGVQAMLNAMGEGQET